MLWHCGHWPFRLFFFIRRDVLLDYISESRPGLVNNAVVDADVKGGYKFSTEILRDEPKRSDQLYLERLWGYNYNKSMTSREDIDTITTIPTWNRGQTGYNVKWLRESLLKEKKVQSRADDQPLQAQNSPVIRCFGHVITNQPP
jgi:hypothetical protein